ncbi:squalene/phytoene synthase family protein [Sphingosinicella rhizophila]|uniref:Squalene/phytoene synthase family protein n=1 Tax=Sphingosinicella rhizophila TaxID=3050082 RepID=A0ABU3Q2Y8_9SPHN|nr:squalene/phytoene synthase family protein [Sphingosinicella sp. GR2756]MDT9597632.1 squalene/phytoene synthase family protein [Sphingosinicella sp. GR2756]
MTPQGLDPDRLLALSYVAAPRRSALQALWHVDAALGAVLTGGREPMISRIKLAWWRDALAGLDQSKPPAEPLLQIIAEQLLPAGISGGELALMESGWSQLLTSEPLEDEELDAYAAGRGGHLFAYSAELLGVAPSEEVRQAGEAWALVDLARHSTEAAEVERAATFARRRSRPQRWPSRLRPLGMLAILSERDSEAGRPRWEVQGAPGRMLRMLRHRLTGR